MKRLAEIGGFLKGAPKLIPQDVLDMSPAKQLEWLSTVDGYFVDFKVSKVGKKRPFPITSIKNKRTGVRDYTNDLVGKLTEEDKEKIKKDIEGTDITFKQACKKRIDELSTHKLDRFTLEDLINFQQVEGRIIQGYYFNEGRNPKIGEVINYLFERRLHHKGNCINDKGEVVKRYELNEQGIRVKATMNPIQELYKLIMNGAYGITLLKEICEQTQIITDNETLDKCLSKSYNVIKSIQTNDAGINIVKKVKPINDHFNRAHIGIEVLGMSKRIMNEVMCIADDLNVPIYYTDTDSLHIEADGLPRLYKKYAEDYGRVLDGKLLGQLHCDFELKGSKHAISKEFVALGKKCYIDHLSDIKDNKITGTHIRLKGVSNRSILNTATNMFDQETLDESTMMLYRDLFYEDSSKDEKNKGITFNLLNIGKKEAQFSPVYDSCFGITQRSDFTRTLCFV